MEDILIGVTDRSDVVFIPDPASTDGSGKTGLTHADLTVSVTRVETDNDVVVTDVTSSLTTLSALTDAHADWGVKEVSSTLAPGLYRIDYADAVFAAGAWKSIVYVMITTSAAAATPKAFRLVARNDLDGARLGLTALPAFAAGAAGGLPTDSAGKTAFNDIAATAVVSGGAITTSGGAVSTVGAVSGAVGSVTGAVGSVTGNVGGNVTGTVASVVGNVGGNVTGSVGSVVGAVGSVTGAVGSVTGNVGGNVTGSVGSVVGAVGSVTGNVGGNVVGTVASVVGAVGSVTGAVGSVTGAVGSVTGNVTGSVGSLAVQAKADVNAEVLDVLNTDTFAEPGQGAPAATASLVTKLGFLYKAWRNRSTQTSSEYALYADDTTTKDQEAVVSDDATTYVRGEVGTGA